MPRIANKKTQLTEQEVSDVLNAWDYLEFSNNYTKSYYGNQFYTPDTVNRQMQNTTLNPVTATAEQILSALKNPKGSETILRNYSTNLEVQNMYYKRLIAFQSTLPSWNFNFDVQGYVPNTELGSPEFQKDLSILDDFCSKFNFKEEFGVALRQMIRQGAYYCVLRDEGEKFVLQELPSDFCKITGRHSHGLLFDFNMEWFVGNYGIDIDMYPRIFKKMYRDVFKSGTDYNPSSNLKYRNSTFVYWHQCSPVNGFWGWKINPEIANTIPYYSGIFPDLAMNDIIRRLQEDNYFIAASKMLVGILGTNTENKTGNTNNQIKITPDILGKFLGVARQGIIDQIGLTILPVDEIKSIDFDSTNDNILDEYTYNIANQSISSNDILFNDDKLNVHQSKLAIAIDENLISSIYSMFESFVEYNVNAKTSKYKFKITFTDTNTPDNRALRLDRFKTMAQYGIVDIQDIARVYDLNPFDMSRRLAMTKNMGLENMITNLVNFTNQAIPSDDVGRPSNPNSDNDSTQDSLARGSNELK